MVTRMKPFPWKCMYCRERTVSPVTLPTYQKELEHDGRKYAVTVPNLRVYQCTKCGEIVLDDEANCRISDALRSAVGLLFPSQIRRMRESLYLTQRRLATALQISESTLSRWETGAQLQQRCMDRMLRAFFDLEELRNYFGSSESAWPASAESSLSHSPSAARQVSDSSEPWLFEQSAIESFDSLAPESTSIPRKNSTSTPPPSLRMVG